MRIIADHNLFGLISAVPTKLYFEVFGKSPDKRSRVSVFLHDPRLGFAHGLLAGENRVHGKGPIYLRRTEGAGGSGQRLVATAAQVRAAQYRAASDRLPDIQKRQDDHGASGRGF